METGYIERYNKKHLIKEETTAHQNTANQSINTPFRPLPEIPGHEPQFMDPQYQRNPYWDDDLYDEVKKFWKRCIGCIQR